MAAGNFLTKLFGSRNERVVRIMQKKVHLINVLESEYQQLSDEDLRAKNDEFKQRVTAGESLEKLLPEAFAVVREASQRTLKMRHFDVQMVGGMVLHEGNIAEMRTGEGKTLASTLPAYLNALTGKGVHIITVNDYLAERDAEWMRPIYDFLGMSVGINLTDMDQEQKKTAYAADITYGTNNEFGFDYLRDNMAFSLEEKVQNELYYAIVDEVDSILIDEARTPLIISGQAEDGSEQYIKVNLLIPKLVVQKEKEGPGDYFLDEKAKQAFLTEEGHQSVETLMIKEKILQEGDSLYAPSNIALMHHISAALRAHTLYQRDVDYIVKDGEVVIVDEHTGRTMPGRRWSDGLHQAVEAKENVAIRNENITLANITFQNYFRLYDKLAGMTGTADTEAYEFQQIYGLEVVVIPTNRNRIRNDLPDQIYMTMNEKYQAIIADIKATSERQQPVLVGTASIESSEYLSDLLKKENVVHKVLNAKFHEKEAEIIAQAGRPGAVTIATNMAGRGTDIVLGGNLEKEIEALTDQSDASLKACNEVWDQRHQQVVEAGGLHIIGSERHESRRIDNQLRGRSGRQGDPGSSRFYLSVEDNLMRIFASERMASIMQRLGMPEGEPIEHSLISKAIETAQRKVEAHNFDIRKQLLKFDDVANDQRKVIYDQRAELMAGDDVSDVIISLQADVVDQVIDQFVPPQSLPEQWDIEGLEQQLKNDFSLPLPIKKWLDEDETRHEDGLHVYVLEELRKQYAEKELLVGEETIRHFEKAVILQSLDNHWREHISNMDHLRQGIHLRGYAQKDPAQEYKRESFELFTTIIEQFKYAVVSIVSRAQVRTESDVEAVEQQRRAAAAVPLEFHHAAAAPVEPAEIPGQPRQPGHPMPPGGHPAAAHGDAHDNNRVLPFVRNVPKIGRNDSCPCGSGKKFKHCHGKPV